MIERILRFLFFTIVIIFIATLLVEYTILPNQLIYSFVFILEYVNIRHNLFNKRLTN